MKSKTSSYVFSYTLLLAMLTAACLPSMAMAAPAKGLNYDGFLTNSAGVAQSGTAPVTIRIYDAATGGNLLFVETHPEIELNNGAFSVPVGSVGDVEPSTAATDISDLGFNTEYFITSEIGSPFNTGEMLRANGLRPQINATPYAYTSYGTVAAATLPSTSTVGRMVFNTTDGKLYAYNGSLWNPVGQGVPVTGAEIVDASVTAVDLSIDSVDASKILNNSITDAEIAASAGIAYSKLNLTAAITGSDIATNAQIPYSALSLTNALTGGDVVDGSIGLADIASGLFEPATATGTASQYLRADKTVQTLDTSVVPENGNLYYTQARFDTALAAASTSSLAEGSNQYFTNARADARVNALFAPLFSAQLSTKSADDIVNGTVQKFYTSSLFNADFGAKTTSNLNEGSNLYYTNARARSALSVGSGLSYNSGSGLLDINNAAPHAWSGTQTFSQANGLSLLPYGNLAGETTKLQWNELTANGNNTVAFRAPDSVPANTVWTLPSSDGQPGTVLSTNGAGLLGWVVPNPATGTVGALQFSNGANGLLADAGNLFWDIANSRLGVGTASPSVRFEVAGGNMRQYWNGNNPTFFIGDSSGVNQYGFLRWDSTADILQIGTQSGGNTLRLSNNNRMGINIDPSSTERVNILGSGGDSNLLRLQRAENSGSGLGFATFRRGDGTELGYISCSATSLLCGLFNASDARVKESVQQTHTGLDDLLQLTVHDYHIIGDDAGHVQQGFIAQELVQHYPDAVRRGDDNSTLQPDGQMWGVDYGRITPLLVKSLQELESLVNATGMYISNMAELGGNLQQNLDSALSIVQSKIVAGSKIIQQFVVGTIVAINGQFSHVATETLHTDHATVGELCIGTEQSKTCLNKSQIDALLQMNQQNAPQAVTASTQAPTTDPASAPETATVVDSTDPAPDLNTPEPIDNPAQTVLP